MKQLPVILPAAALMWLWACSSVQDDWNRATAANTVAAYQQFLNRHPTGAHSSDAADRIRVLGDDEAWSQAKAANSFASYRDYLDKQPNGSHVKDAREAQTAVDRAADWLLAKKRGSVEAINGFSNEYKDGSEANEARVELAALSAYQVKLTGGRIQRQAERARERLDAEYSNVLHGWSVVPPSPGKDYELISDPMSRSRADAACAQLEKTHPSCEVVKS